jgi:hypothetical protein
MRSLSVLTTFGYSEGFLSMLKDNELDDLYVEVSRYVWSRIFNEFREKDKIKLDLIKKAMKDSNYSKLVQLVPDYYTYIQKYGKDYVNTTTTGRYFRR